MRAFPRLVLATCVALTVMAAPASAGVKVDIYDQTPRAFDGGDMYEVTYGPSGRSRTVTKANVWRVSVATGKRRKIGFVNAPYLGVRSIQAAGGRVALQVASTPLFGSTFKFGTKVYVLNRDGSGKRIVASGSAQVGRVQEDFAEVVECGDVFGLTSVTNSGSVVISRRFAKRSGTGCKGKWIDDQLSFVEVARTGARRTIFDSVEKPGSEQSAVEPSFAEVEVNGDYAALVTPKTLKVYLKNLVTGVTVGPFKDSVRLAGQKLQSIGVSVGLNGVLAVSSSGKGKGSGSGLTWTDVFANPADPLTAVRSDLHWSVRFCGSHLVGMDYDDARDKNLIVELDPTTLAVKRELAALGNLGYLEYCNDKELVVSRESKDMSSLLLRVIAIP